MQETSLFARSDLARSLVRTIDQFISPESSLLDVAAGTGYFSIAFAEKGHRVVALDLHKNLLEHLEDKIKSTSVIIKTVAADMNKSFSLPDEEFNVVTSLRANRYISGTTFYEEAFRVLAPGGKIVLPMFKIDPPFWIRYAGISQHITVPGVLEDLKQTGFKKVEAHDCRKLFKEQGEIPGYYHPYALIIGEK